MKLNFEGIKMQKWNIPTDRALRGDEENGFICLVIIFTSGVTVILIFKNLSYFVFSADDSKTSVTLWAIYLKASEISYLAFSENTMDYWILSDQ